MWPLMLALALALVGCDGRLGDTEFSAELLEAPPLALEGEVGLVDTATAPTTPPAWTATPARTSHPTRTAGTTPRAETATPTSPPANLQARAPTQELVSRPPDDPPAVGPAPPADVPVGPVPPADPGGPMADARSVVRLPIVVNGAHHGLGSVLVLGERVLVSAEVLAAAGLIEPGSTVAVEGEQFVDLAADQRLSAEIDPETLAVVVEAPPEAFRETRLDGAARRTIPLSDARTAYANLAVALHDGVPRGVGELAISTPWAALWSTAVADARGMRRGMTAIVADRPERRQRVTLGDMSAVAGGLGGAVLLGGIGFERRFDLDPGYLPTTGLDYSSAVSVPSTVELVVDGHRTASWDVGPGPFTVADLPVGAWGASEIIVRDAFGNARSVPLDLRGGWGLLAPGVSSWRAHAGLERPNLSDDLGYEAPVALGTLRHGVTRGLTAGGRVEARADELVSGDGSATALLPLGQLDLTVGGSVGREGRGAPGASVRWLVMGDTASISIGAAHMGASYTTLSLPASADRAIGQGDVSMAWRAGPVGLGVTGRGGQLRDRGLFAQAGARVDLRPRWRPQGFFTTSVTHTRTAVDRPATHLWMTFLFLPTRTSNAAIGTSFTEAGQVTTLDVSRPLGARQGLGANAGLDLGAAQRADGSLYGQSRYVRARADVRGGRDLSTHWSGEIATAIVLAGGGLHLSRPVHDGFALLRTGNPGVVGELQSQPVGRTGARGAMIIPDLASYEQNRVSVRLSSLPVGADIEQTEAIVATRFRGGAIVDLAGPATTAVRARIQGPEGPPERGTTLRLAAAGEVWTTPVGHDGLIELLGVPPGTSRLLVEGLRSPCHVTVTIPAPPPPLIDLGGLRCD